MSATLRFAPSPNGRLHLGHAFSALLNARIAQAHGGRLLLRIEDIDLVRSKPELIAGIHEDLAWLGLRFDDAVRRQSEHMPVYAQALADLAGRGLAYPCFCSRSVIATEVAALEAAGRTVARDPDGSPLYPGTCRALNADEAETWRAGGAAHSWRLAMDRALAAAPGPHGYRRFDADWEARAVAADPARWGDAMIARRDVPTSYHLSVVVDDDAQGITHVVRGQDLRAATDLHGLLQALLGLRAPAYHHHALIRTETGDKLAKSKGSESLADLRAGGVTAAAVRASLASALEAGWPSEGP